MKMERNIGWIIMKNKNGKKDLELELLFPFFAYFYWGSRLITALNRGGR